MSKRDWRLLVEDMLESIGKIERYLENYDYEAFFKDSKTHDTVIRNLEIIGEAARALPDEIRQRHSYIPWAPVIALRNRLIHGYATVDLRIVWEICEHELPQLRMQLERLREEEGG